MTLQQKMNDPSGQWNQIWTSPSRDLAHVLDYAVAHAINFTTEQLKREGAGKEHFDELFRYALQWQNFFKSVPDPDIRSIGDLYEQADFESEPGTYAGNMVNKWLLRTLIGMYYTGVREALHGERRTHGFQYIEQAAARVAQLYAHECLSPWQRFKNRFFKNFTVLEKRK